MNPLPAGSIGYARPALALSGGLLTAFSLPPWGFWPLALIGVATFAVASGGNLTTRHRAVLGFSFGAGWMLVGMGWMWFLTVPGYLVAGCLFAGLHAAAAAATPSSRWAPVARPAAHTLVEALRFAFPFGGVPVASLAISQAAGPFLGIARVGGAVLLTWIVFQIGFSVAAMLDLDRPASRSARRWRTPHALVPLAVIVGLVLVSIVAPAGYDITSGEPLTIAAVQGGGEQGTSALDVPSDLVTEAHLAATAQIEPDDDLDLVVWPENAIDVDNRPFEESWEFRAVVEQSARLGVPFSVGVTEDSEYSSYPVDDSFVNAQVVVTPRGEATSRYEKVQIVPFGEFVPLRGPLEALGAPLDQIPSDATRGRDPARITLPDGTQLGVMISWEVFFGERARDAAGGDATILLNPTNGASYTSTILQTQQIASSRLRAVETGRWIVQVSPTGFSAFISPDGDVFDRTDVSEQRVITRAVPERAGRTWYHVLGDWLWIVAFVMVFGIATYLGRIRVPTTTASVTTPPTTV